MVMIAYQMPMSIILHIFSYLSLSASFEVGTTVILILEIKLIEFFEVPN